MTTSTGRAPGRLDLLGGVADYSGALVLELPTRVATTVTATPADRFTVGPATFTAPELSELVRLPYPDVRRAIPGLAVIVNSFSNERDTRALADKAIAFYRR